MKVNLRFARIGLTVFLGWKNPIYPGAAVSSPNEPYDLLEGVEEEPVSR